MTPALDELLAIGREYAPLVAAVAALLALLVALLVLRRLGTRDRDEALQALASRLHAIEEAQQRLERVVREDLRGAREENAGLARHLREEVAASVKQLGDGVGARMGEMSDHQRQRFEHFAIGLKDSHDAQARMVGEMRGEMFRQLEAMKLQQGESQTALRQQVATNLAGFGDATRAQMNQLFEIQKGQHDGFQKRIAEMTEANARAGEALRLSVDAQLTALRTENAEKLEVMRATVDEKLQGTLEQRLGESFKMVGERLEAVHKGLGEMQTLATGVGDLKRVLTNVKARGTWGEVQLGALLEQVLTPGQYVANAATSPHSGERVEFAIRLPGHEDGAEVLLPIDAKFPIEDYERLQHASEIGDVAGVEAASKALEMRIRGCARDICTKYINPPATTDFGIMFLPTEGLYAEVIRRPGLCDELQRDWRVVVAGPTTLNAILNSLQMGFRTLAIQKRSSEVWQVLAAVKTEFGKFGPVLEKVQKKLQEASNQMDLVGRRERALQRSLRDVAELPAGESQALLALPEIDVEADERDLDDARDAAE